MTTRKRIIAVVLAFFMVFAMMPLAAQEAYADDTLPFGNGYVFLGNTYKVDFSSEGKVTGASCEYSYSYVKYDDKSVTYYAPIESWNLGQDDIITIEINNGAKILKRKIVLSLNFSSLSLYGTVPDLTYTGKAVKHSSISFKTQAEYEEVKLGRDFTATYKNNTKIGKATVYLKGKGCFVGSKTMTFNILPKGTTIKAPKKGKKSFTARWAKQKAKMPKARIGGYHVQYSTDKNFKTGVSNKYVKGYKKTSKKIKGLQKKKIYYVRVRTFMKVGGKYYYSTWSKVKSVKTK